MTNNAIPIKATEIIPPEVTTPAGTTINTEELAESYLDYVQLTKGQKSVLLAIMNEFLSENTLSDPEIADLAGVHVKTVYNCRKNARFNAAIVQIMPELVKTKLPRYIRQIEKHGEKSFEPLKFLLQYAGLYVTTTQSVNLHANIGADNQLSSPGDTVDAALTKLLALGWSPDRIATRARELQAEGIR